MLLYQRLPEAHPLNHQLSIRRGAWTARVCWFHPHTSGHSPGSTSDPPVIGMLSRSGRSRMNNIGTRNPQMVVPPIYLCSLYPYLYIYLCFLYIYIYISVYSLYELASDSSGIDEFFFTVNQPADSRDSLYIAVSPPLGIPQCFLELKRTGTLW